MYVTLQNSDVTNIGTLEKQQNCYNKYKDQICVRLKDNLRQTYLVQHYVHDSE